MPLFEKLFEKSGLIKLCTEVEDRLFEVDPHAVLLGKVNRLNKYMQNQVQRESAGELLSPIRELGVAADCLNDLFNLRGFNKLENKCVDFNKNEDVLNKSENYFLLQIIEYAIRNKQPLVINSRCVESFVLTTEIMGLCLLYNVPYPLVHKYDAVLDAAALQKAKQVLEEGGVVLFESTRFDFAYQAGINNFMDDVALPYALKQNVPRLNLMLDHFTSINLNTFKYIYDNRNELSLVCFFQYSNLMEAEIRARGGSEALDGYLQLMDMFGYADLKDNLFYKLDEVYQQLKKEMAQQS